jgi:class 3 adenylate cyclase
MHNESNLVILFADVADSTRLYGQLGDAEARNVVAKCLDIMSEATRLASGTVVKTIGDAVMSTFVGASEAATAAVDIQERVAEDPEIGGRGIKIRVGFHAGSVIVEPQDVFGDAVNLASRITTSAKPDQILTTAETVELLSDAWKLVTRRVDRAAVRGRRDRVDLFELVWHFDSATWVGQGDWMAAPGGTGARLVLNFEGQSIEIGDSRPVVTLGRADQNDVVIKDGMVSRLHAAIEYRNGRFILTDRSINGTYLQLANGEYTVIRRDSREIDHAGIISLGRVPAATDARPVRFAVAQ